MTPEDVAAACGLSDDSLEKLRLYAALLLKWQKKINLIGPSTIVDVWQRHFFDSAQVFSLLPPQTRTLVDLGSGAGFPGLVLALLGVPDVHLIESDSRKAAFLRETARQIETPVTIHTQRIEAVPPFAADVVTARALAPLNTFLAWAAPFCREQGQCLFLKGKKCDEELILAAKEWKMQTEKIVSRSDPSGVIIRIKGVSRD